MQPPHEASTHEAAGDESAPEEKGKEESTISIMNATGMVANCAIGSGVLAFPYAMRCCGIALGVVVILLSAGLLMGSLHILASASALSGGLTYQASIRKGARNTRICACQSNQDLAALPPPLTPTRSMPIHPISISPIGVRCQSLDPSSARRWVRPSSLLCTFTLSELAQPSSM